MSIKEAEPVTSLTRQQTWNIWCLIMAFSCVVAYLTLIVGTGAVVIKSVGGDTSLAPFPLGVFFLGMSLISFAATHWIFELWGRKYGLWAGCGISIVGVVIAIFGCLESSPAVILIANIFLGAGAGISMYVRFAAVEVVPPEYSSRAVSWVLCGGCLAAFAGPEAAQATQGIFGDDHLAYLGVFVVAAAFVLAQAIFVGLVTFPSPASAGVSRKEEKQEQEVSIENFSAPEAAQETDQIQKDGTGLLEAITQESSDDVGHPKTTNAPRPNRDSIMSTPEQLVQIIRHPNFYNPVIISGLSWAIMAMPMSIFRITMRDLGYTDRQSLTVIEFHFLAMYSPGFFSGAFIKQKGVVRAGQLAVILFLIAFAFNMSAADRNDALYSWYLGLIFVGFGWNFGFTGATVWVTKAYLAAPHLKAKVQAVNDGLVFLISGSFIFSTGFLYDDAGGGGIPGWRLLNYAILGLMALFMATLYGYVRWQGEQDRYKHDNRQQQDEEKGIQDTELADVS